MGRLHILEHELRIMPNDACTCISHDFICGVQRLDAMFSLYQPAMAEVWATLDLETRDRLLEEADAPSANVTLQTLKQARQGDQKMSSQPLVSTISMSLDSLHLCLPFLNRQAT